MPGATRLLTAGGGAVQLQPASSIASDVTVELPVVAQRLIGNKTPGTVLQVVSTIYTPANTQTTALGWIDSGLTALSITPTFASSKILVGFYMIGGHVNNNGAGNLGSFYTIYRDINGGGYSNLGDSAGGMVNTRLSNSAAVYQTQVDLVWVDTPNTTSQCNYKAYYRKQDDATQGYFSHSNYAQNKILGLIMEIAA